MQYKKLLAAARWKAVKQRTTHKCIRQQNSDKKVYRHAQSTGSTALTADVDTEWASEREKFINVL